MDTNVAGRQYRKRKNQNNHTLKFWLKFNIFALTFTQKALKKCITIIEVDNIKNEIINIELYSKTYNRTS